MGKIFAAVKALSDFPLQVKGAQGTVLKYVFGPGNLPEKAEGFLPCALTYPNIGSTGTAKALAQMGNAMQVAFDVDQYIMWASEVDNFGKREYEMMTYLDNFIDAWKTFPFYGPISAPPTHGQPQYTWEIVQTSFAGKQYHSIHYKFKVLLNV